MSRIFPILLTVVVSGLWLYLLFSVWQGPTVFQEPAASRAAAVSWPGSAEKIVRSTATIEHPRRFRASTGYADPPPLSEIERNLTLYLSALHTTFKNLQGNKAVPVDIWEAYLNITKNTVMKWDDENRHRFPKPREDGSIFVSLGTYRDPYCPMTIKSLYSMAKHPDRLFVGLFQQNCFEKKCRTGVLEGGKVEDAPPDVDCYKEFCASEEGIASNACNTGQVRLFNVNESESLGPYMARYLGSKFYRGEQYYLQIDSHSEFVKNWDYKLTTQLNAAPARKPVLSTYPPDSGHNWRDTIGFRMCDSEFAADELEQHIIRLSPSRVFETHIPPEPSYSPFVAAGFYFIGGGFLHEVPFDPLLPWIFMGEEISLSARLWTSGYDIFSPTTNVLNHYYVRRHYPKFWETVNRFFRRPVHNQLVEMTIKRVKNMLRYPENSREMVSPSSLLHRIDDFSMGRDRSYETYMRMVGIEPSTKVTSSNKWCTEGRWPEEAEQYRYIGDKYPALE